MSDKQRLQTIQKDIKTIDKCIDMCIDYDEVDYLMIIKEHMLTIENELKKQIAVEKAIKDFHDEQTKHSKHT